MSNQYTRDEDADKQFSAPNISIDPDDGLIICGIEVVGGLVQKVFVRPRYGSEYGYGIGPQYFELFGAFSEE